MDFEMLCKLKNTPEVEEGTGESSHVADYESEGQRRANMFLELSASCNSCWPSPWLESSWLAGAWSARSLTLRWLDDWVRRNSLLNLTSDGRKLRQQPKGKATFPTQPKDDWVISKTVCLQGHTCNSSSRVSVVMKRALQQTRSPRVWIIYVHNMQAYTDPLIKVTSGNHF